MSNRFFPTLPAAVHTSRASLFVTKTQKTDNGRRLSVKKRAAPGYRYTISVSLRSWLSEERDLFQFFESHSGSYESFLYIDPQDGVTRRVTFTDDELPLDYERGGVWTGSFDLETVVL